MTDGKGLIQGVTLTAAEINDYLDMMEHPGYKVQQALAGAIRGIAIRNSLGDCNAEVATLHQAQGVLQALDYVFDENPMEAQAEKERLSKESIANDLVNG